MKKYTCPECGKTFLNRKPKACSQCGCPSENFVVEELATQATQVVQPQYAQQPQQQYAQQPQYVQDPTAVELSLEGFLNFLSVILLLAGIAGGMYVLIKGSIEASEANRYSYEHVSAAPAVIGGLVIILMSMIQFGLIRLYVKMSRRLESIDSKIH